MAAGRSGPLTDPQKGEAAGSRPVNLQGDSPEVVAFALLRHLAQLEQASASKTGVVFDRDWLLDAYADCLDAVKGNRPASAGDYEPPARPARGRPLGR